MGATLLLTFCNVSVAAAVSALICVSSPTCPGRTGLGAERGGSDGIERIRSHF